MWACKYLLKFLFSVLGVCTPVSGIAGLYVVLFLIFSGTTILFSHGGQYCLTFPSAVHKNSSFSTSPCPPPPPAVVILMGVVLIYISQEISNIQHLFMCLFAICLSSLEKIFQVLCPFFKIGFFQFLLLS